MTAARTDSDMATAAIDRRTAVKGMAGTAAVFAGLGLVGCDDRSAATADVAKRWLLDGVTVENCTCNAFCVLNLAPFKLKDWHRSACVWSIRNGHSNGVDLSGTRLAMAYELPPEGAGPAASRIYLDTAMNAAQRAELESILTGTRGGVFATLGDASSKSLPILSTPITLTGGETPGATVGDIARVTLRRRKTPTGKQTVLVDAVYPEAFGVTVEDLCDGTGSAWRDPGMTHWTCGGGSGIADFKLSA